MFRVSLIVCLIALPLASAGEPRKELPGPPPSIVVLSKVDAAKKEVGYSARSKVMVPVATTVKVIRNGKEETVTELIFVAEERVIETAIPLEKVKIFTTQGKAVTVEDALKALKVGTTVVLSGDQSMVDLRCARVLRDDTLILTSPPMPRAGDLPPPPRPGDLPPPPKADPEQ